MPKSINPADISLSLIFKKCEHPKEGYEGNSAHSTGGVIRSSVVSYWWSRGALDDFVRLEDDKCRGNPGKAAEISALVTSLKMLKSDVMQT